MTRLALIHPTHLLAQELRESLDRRRELWLDLQLLSDDPEEIGHLTEARGAAAMVQPLDGHSLDGIDVVFFGGSLEKTRPLLDRLPASATAILLAPETEPSLGRPLVAGVNLELASRGEILISPHPGAVALSHLLHPLRGFGPRRATATLLQPVSVFGNEALDEVLNQTRAILAFADNPPKEIFSTQLTFNTLPTASETPSVVTDHLHAVLGEDLAVEVQTLQMGIFHSFGISLFVELSGNPDLAEVEEALAAHPMIDRAVDPELLGPIDAAAREELILGSVTQVPGTPGVFRIWAVMDNLTCGGALNALHILEALGLQITH